MSVATAGAAWWNAGWKRGERRRWLTCAAAVIVLHAILLAILIQRQAMGGAAAADGDAPLPIELVDTSTPEPPKDSPPKPHPDELPPQAKVEAEAAAVTPPQSPSHTAPPADKPQPQAAPRSGKAVTSHTQKAARPPLAQVRGASRQMPSLAAQQPMDLAAAPESAPASAELESYKEVLSGYIIRDAVYPPSAQELHQEGLVYVEILIDRHGEVLSYHLERSSGIDALDDEALALFAHNRPFPAIPLDLPAPLTLLVPFRFSLC
jgi:protein TonB